MIFKFDLKKVSSLGSELTARGFKLSARVGVPIALGLSTLGCGKSSQSNSTLSQEELPPSAFGADGIFKGDSLRTGLLVTFRKARAATIPSVPPTFEILDRVKMEVLDRVINISEAKDKVEVDRMEKVNPGRAVWTTEWFLTEKLKPYFFSSVEEVRNFCEKASGQMEKVKSVAGELDACKVTKKFVLSFKNSQGEPFMMTGLGQRWMAAVPFGWIKAEWTSEKRRPNDVEVSISQQILSYRTGKDGKGYPQSENQNRRTGWTLEECENDLDGNIQPNR